MSLELLQHLWYAVIGIAIVAYVILDGFDLGVGCLHLFARNDYERRILLNSIGPVWDGNEVWLIIIAGGLFAGFPEVYASLFSGFYSIFMLMLAGVIFRAVAIEFRSKVEGKRWRQIWDFLFFFSSLSLAFLAGVIIGNLIIGVPVNENREIWMRFPHFFTLYPVVLGIFTIFLLAMHGHHFIMMKTENGVQKHFEQFVFPATALFILFYILITILTWQNNPHMVERMQQYPFLLSVPLLTFFTIVGGYVLTKRGSHGLSFLFSSLTIFLFFLTFAIGFYPNLILSSLDPAYHLTLYNSSSQDTTLKVCLVIALIGVPVVLAYGGFVYYIFRQKTRLHDHSY
jgi:cytochrome d ubiquinol oxidase subunit II